jgi:hypothetical protein
MLCSSIGSCRNLPPGEYAQAVSRTNVNRRGLSGASDTGVGLAKRGFHDALAEWLWQPQISSVLHAPRDGSGRPSRSRAPAELAARLLRQRRAAIVELSTLGRRPAGPVKARQGAMAQVRYIERPGALISTFTWLGLRNGDRGEPIRNASGNISFQIEGDFGRGGKVVIEASRDGHIYETVNDRRSHPALVTHLAPDDSSRGRLCEPRVYATR